MKKLTTFLALSLCAFTMTIQAIDITNIGGARVKVVSVSRESFDNAPSETRAMQTINAISNNGPLNVVYVESDKSEVVVKGDKDIFCQVQTQYKDGTLNISLAPGTYTKLWIQVIVYAPSLNTIKCTGSGDVQAAQVTNKSENLDIRVTGSANVNIEKIFCSRDVDLHVSGSGMIRPNAVECQMLDINVTGSGDVRPGTTKCVKVDAHVTGSGDVKFGTLDCNEAEVTVTGSGDVRFSGGKANFVKARVTGSGDIQGELTYQTLDKKTSGSGSIVIKK